MATTEPQTAAAKAAAAEAEERGPTKRVVLRQARVLVLPEGVDPEKVGEAMRLLGIKGKLPDVRASRGPHEAWIVVGEFEGASKDKAIEAHAGKPGTDSAKVGTYKAPGASAWAGGCIYDAPPKPLVQRRTLED